MAWQPRDDSPPAEVGLNYHLGPTPEASREDSEWPITGIDDFRRKNWIFSILCFISLSSLSPPPPFSHGTEVPWLQPPSRLYEHRARLGGCMVSPPCAHHPGQRGQHPTQHRRPGHNSLHTASLFKEKNFQSCLLCSALSSVILFHLFP